MNGTGAPGDLPRAILIAALGGEGGGVLANWIVEAALRAKLPVQATSVPGVAQRTGATSYYVEFLARAGEGATRPVFALMPVPGRVDVVLSSELLEGVRMIERGFVDDERTTLITARHRVLTTKEKMAMGDGRVDDERLFAAASSAAARCIAIDMRDIAQRNRTVISAVMYGALAGSGSLPWPREIDEAVIRDGGLGVDASLAGYDEGFAAAAAAATTSRTTADTRAADADAAAAATADGVAPVSGAGAPARGDAVRRWPALADIVARGEARARDYQDEAYADAYRSRVDALCRAAGDAPSARPALEEAARHLALWMTYEDIARVADLKTRASRFARVRAEVQAAPGDIVTIREHLCPGLDEIAAVVPPGPGRWLRRRATRTAPVGARGRGITLTTSSVHGFALLRLLAGLARWRRHSLRFLEEQAAIEAWLAALTRALPVHAGFAAALAGLPRLRKGYSDTFERGRASYERIFAARVEPVVAPDDAAQVALRDAIDAALADPDAPRPAPTVDAPPGRAGPAAAAGQPIHWHSMKRPATERPVHSTEGDRP
ncbi:MAG: indolepyruvate oxidoreductase subunit beta family protein [Lautropia sp.]